MLPLQARFRIQRKPEEPNTNTNLSTLQGVDREQAMLRQGSIKLGAHYSKFDLF